MEYFRSVPVPGTLGAAPPAAGPGGLVACRRAVVPQVARHQVTARAPGRAGRGESNRGFAGAR